MKRKRRQRWIAMLMAVVMLTSTMGSTGLAQSLQTESHAAQDHRAIHSLIASQSQLGYIVVGIFSFFLGSITTALLFRVKEHRRKDTEKKS